MPINLLSPLWEYFFLPFVEEGINIPIVSCTPGLEEEMFSFWSKHHENSLFSRNTKH